MPIYEFKCRKCDHSFDYFAEKINEAPSECPACKAPDPQKQISAFNPGKGNTSSGAPSCASGACPTGSCPTGSCPM